MDTIFAQATAQGRAGVAVVRLSGPSAKAIATKLVGKLPEPRVASVKPICDELGVEIDRALILVFDAPKSFTGEDVVEFQLHGSIAVVRRISSLLSAYGARHAEPGEFTRRALGNEKLDLVQVEALGELLEAETEEQRKQAQKGLLGTSSERIGEWRTHLTKILALLEASIDFAEEAIPDDALVTALSQLHALQDSFKQALDDYAGAKSLRHGFEVALVGPPNAGKSTLFNALLKRDTALVSDIAGTTRDILEARLDIRGIPVTLLDMAGLRESASDEIERQGVERAQKRAAAADLRLFLAPASSDDALSVPRRPGDIQVHPKADMTETSAPGISVSGKTGQGLETLISAIHGELVPRIPGDSTITTERQHRKLLGALGYVARSCELLAPERRDADLAAEELLGAANCLQDILGRLDVEEILGEVFSSFCIGK